MLKPALAAGAVGAGVAAVWWLTRRPTSPAPAVLGPENTPVVPAFTAVDLSVPGGAPTTKRVDEREVLVYLPARRGPAPPLWLLFHGTGQDGATIFGDAGVRAAADTAGAIVVAPTARWMPSGDWDHASEDRYWQTHPAVTAQTNPDLALVSSLISSARLQYRVGHVYTMGHSSGGFFALLAAVAFRGEGVAGFATSGAGLVRCQTTGGCRFVAPGGDCMAMGRMPGWCSCQGEPKPVEIPSVGAPLAGYLTHGTDDPLVSVYYSCALAERLVEVGWPVRVRLRNGEGHDVPPSFAAEAWAYLASVDGRR